MANNTEQERLKERLKELQQQYADSLSDVYLTDAQVNALAEDLAPSIEAEATRREQAALDNAVCRRCGHSKYDKEIDLPSIVDAVEFRREQYGWRQGKMARAIGWSDSHYSEFIAGKRKMSYRVAVNAFKVGVPPVVLLQIQKPAELKRQAEGEK